MDEKKSGLSSFLKAISYKKKEKVEEFYIPEVEENREDHKEQEQEDDRRRKKAHKSKNSREMKQPVSPTPVSEIKKEGAERDSENELPSTIEENIDFIKERFNAKVNKDIIIRQFMVGGKYKAFIAYLDGMVDRTTINSFILRPLLKEISEEVPGSCQLEYILSNVLETNQAKKIEKPEDVIYDILTGNTCLYVDGCNYYLSNETKGYDKRGVEKPVVEGVVKGAQEAFNENLRTNITLLRRIIKNNRLTTEFIKIGSLNQNYCAIVYLDGIVNPAIVKEVKRRIKSIKTDFVMGDGFVEQFIEDHPMSLVPTVLTTERPDRTSSHIIEGKVAIIGEGVPFAIIVPVTIGSMIHSPEDSSLRWQYGSMLRLIRLGALFIATLLPGIYMALTNFHREMLPTDLLIAIGKARENVPFPTIIEILLMELSFELIREAGIRIPGIIGNTIGIIGALILGQAAVQANLVSPVMIIIVSVTGLGNFAIPNFSLAFAARLVRILFIILGAALGFYGISLGIVASAALLSNLKSFGVPFLTLLAPKTRGSNDMILKKPVWLQELRPDYVNALKIERQPDISRGWRKQDADVTKPGEEEEDE